MRIYKFDNDQLSYVKIGKKRIATVILYIFSVVIVSFFVGVIVGSRNNSNTTPDIDEMHHMASKYDLNPEHDMAWKDSVFRDYKKRADMYLNRGIFEGTPLSGDILALCARNAYDSTGILLPVELALAQCQWESGMGREGRNPRTNPFNIGENDSGTVLWFETTFEGTQAYYYYMCNDYLRCSTMEELFVNFVNCNGHRYASGDYELHVPGQYYHIKKWLDSNMK